VRTRVLLVAVMVWLAGCHSGTRFCDTGSFTGGGAAVLGVILAPLVVLGFVAKDIAEFLSRPAPWDQSEGSTP
jgi:hypothetical protein